MRRRVLILCIAAAVCAGVSGQETEPEPEPVAVYGLGDQTFSIHAGVLTPLFFFGSGTLEPAAGHLRIGASGALRWGTFLDNNFTLGAELGGMFASTVLGRTLVSIPITGVADYAIRFYPFEISFHGNLGVNLLRLDEDLYVGPIVKPGVSGYWNYNAEWSFGLRVEYWFVPEIYFGETPPASHTRVGNFLTVNLSTLYHF